MWTRTNPNPRNTVEQDQNIKMWAVSHKFDGGRFVTVLLCVRGPPSHGFFGPGFVAGNVTVGKFDVTSAYMREARRFLFFFDLISTITGFFSTRLTWIPEFGKRKFPYCLCLSFEAAAFWGPSVPLNVFRCKGILVTYCAH